MSKKLSKRMASWLEHVRAADEHGKSVRAYALSIGVSAGAMYQAKSQLMKIGAWPRRGRDRRATNRHDAGTSFVAARVVSEAMACRVSHASGWRIECESLPPAQWLARIVGHAGQRGGDDVAA